MDNKSSQTDQIIGATGEEKITCKCNCNGDTKILTCKEICQMFCCPPCPGPIAEKFAFLGKPPQSSYKMVSCNNGSSYKIEISELSPCQYTDYELKKMESAKVKTKFGHNICMIMIKCGLEPRYTILYSHGNAEDIGRAARMCLFLSNMLNVNVLLYDYSGYGESEGHPTERNVYSDIEAAFSTLTTHYGVKSDGIILFGISIGTVPAIDLASKYQIAGLILQAPLLSALRVVCPGLQRTWCCDSFVNIDKLEKIHSPTLVIHGTKDEVISFSHGKRTYELLPITTEPYWADGDGHNSPLTPKYITHLRSFIHERLGASRLQKAFKL